MSPTPLETSVRAAFQAIEDIHRRGLHAIVVGGTGFYLKALVFGLWAAPKADPGVREALQSLPTAELYQRLLSRDELSALRITAGDRYRLIRALELIASTGKTPSELEATHETRPNPIFDIWIIDRQPQELNQRIRIRSTQMLDSGLVEEVTRLRQIYPQSRALSAVGYAQVCAYLDGILPQGRKISQGLQGLQEEIELATRQLVKQQRTWFRSFGERTGAHRICLEEVQANWSKLGAWSGISVSYTVILTDPFIPSIVDRELRPHARVLIARTRATLLKKSGLPTLCSRLLPRSRRRRALGSRSQIESRRRFCRRIRQYRSASVREKGNPSGQHSRRPHPRDRRARVGSAHGSQRRAHPRRRTHVPLGAISSGWAPTMLLGLGVKGEARRARGSRANRAGNRAPLPGSRLECRIHPAGR